jgi:hypothetical protein
MLVCKNLYVIYCRYITPPHDKLCICFCDVGSLFFFINSNPRLPADAQEIIYRSEHVALSHDSYIDLSGARTFSTDELANANDRGPVPDIVLDRIRLRLTTGATTLPGKHRQLAFANLA